MKGTFKIVKDKDRGFKKAIRLMFTKKQLVDVGVVAENADRPDAPDNVDRAIIHEYGVEIGPIKIPARPFIGRTFSESEMPLYMLELKKHAEAALPPLNKPFRQGLEEFGQNALEDLLAVFNTENEPPLSPVTIAKKGHDTILVDTGTLQDSLDYKVR